MKIKNERVQWAVGQGGFHSGNVEINNSHGERVFHYIYDCGAVPAHSNFLKNSIDKYVSKLGGAKIDFLYISHFHEDHVNGLEYLMSKEVKASFIFIPLLSCEERLRVYCQWLAFNPKDEPNEFYVHLIVDPIAALSRFQPDRVLFVKAGEREDFDEGGESPSEADGWKFVGRGRIRALDSSDGIRFDGNNNTLECGVVEGVRDVLISGHRKQCDWLLAPYVDPCVVDNNVNFLSELVNLKLIDLGMILDSERLSKIISNKKNRSKLRGIYKKALKNVHDDLNATSLSLYSGPLCGGDAGSCGCMGFIVHRNSVYNNVHHRSRFSRRCRIGWLGTGDALMSDERQRASFLNHYKNILKNVGTLVIPHHGSDHNFSEGFLDAIEPAVCVVAADSYKGWKHPGTMVVQEVARRGIPLIVITSGVGTDLEEEAF